MSLIRRAAPPAGFKTHEIRALHQILIVDSDASLLTIPAALTRHIKSLKSVYPLASHTLWTKTMIRDFIAAEFARDVLNAFDSLRPHAYQADLGRYCLLYAVGGLYSDLLVQHYQPWVIDSRFGVAGFRQAWHFRPNVSSISNSLLWAKPGRPEFMLAIQRIIEHCKRRFYGDDRVDPTGPWLLGRAFGAAAADLWRADKSDDQYLGVHEAASLDSDLVFIARDDRRREIAARIQRPAGSWEGFALKGTNDYAAMCTAREVYR